jgi:2-iminobutanoate/2-iminopropanoate deaminase
MELVNSENIAPAIGPYSHAVKYNGLIYTSGQIALMPNGELVENDIKKQTRQVFANLKNVLDEVDSDLSKVIKATIYLKDMDDFGIVNVLYAEEFGDHKPARSTVAVKTLPKDVLIEIDVIAVANDYHGKI